MGIYTRVIMLTALLSFFQNCGAPQSEDQCDSSGNCSASGLQNSANNSTSSAPSSSTTRRPGSVTSGTLGGAGSRTGSVNTSNPSGSFGTGSPSGNSSSGSAGGFPTIPGWSGTPYTPGPASDTSAQPTSGPLRIRTQLQGKELFENEVATLTVAADGGKPPYTYTWLYNGQALPTNGSSNASNSLSVPLGNYMNWKNVGKYQVRITDSIGDSILSSEVELKIREANISCPAQDYYNLVEDRPEIAIYLLAPDSPIADHMVPAKDFFVTPLGTKYLIPLEFNPFSIPGYPSVSYSPIRPLLDNSYIKKVSWKMPATSHGDRVEVACSPSVYGVNQSNWMKDFNEFPDNPDFVGGTSYYDWETYGYCPYWGSSSSECLRTNTQRYLLKGQLVFECRNNKFKYVSGSCDWEKNPNYNWTGETSVGL